MTLRLLDLEQLLFDALAEQIDAANDLSSASGAVSHLPASHGVAIAPR